MPRLVLAGPGLARCQRRRGSPGHRPSGSGHAGASTRVACPTWPTGGCSTQVSAQRSMGAPAMESRPSAVPALQLRRGPDRIEARWLLGVCQAAAGQFGTAAAQLQHLLQVPRRRPQHPPLRRRGGGDLASIHRQVGRHAEASEFDEWAAQVAPGDAQIQFDAALGQAADSVGLGDRDTALAFVTHARSLCSDEPRWWRERVRLGWVQSEVALMLDRPADAVAALNRSVRRPSASVRRGTSPNLLFLGVAMQAAGDPGRWRRSAAARCCPSRWVPGRWCGSPGACWPTGCRAVTRRRLSAVGARRSTRSASSPRTCRRTSWRSGRCAPDVAPLFRGG